MIARKNLAFRLKDFRVKKILLYPLEVMQRNGFEATDWTLLRPLKACFSSPYASLKKNKKKILQYYIIGIAKSEIVKKIKFVFFSSLKPYQKFLIIIIILNVRIIRS